MKENRILLIVMISLLLVGCGGTGAEDLSGNHISLAEEIAEGVSEDVIPVEATKYTTVSFNIPEGMIADAENTETEQYYLAQDMNDYSFIAYTRSEVIENLDYDSITEADYQESVTANVDSGAVLSGFTKIREAEYLKICFDVQYVKNGVSYYATEYIYVTGDYVFSIVFCQGGTTDWSTAFSESMQSVSLQSVASAVSENQP